MRNAVGSFLIVLAVLLTNSSSARAAPPAGQDIDWAKAPVVQIRIALGFFHPGLVILPLRQPVRLVFRNGSGRTHDFVTNFFTTVSQRSGVKQGGTRVVLQPASAVEYDIVPQVAGTFTVSTVMYEPAGYVSPAQIVVR